MPNTWSIKANATNKKSNMPTIQAIHPMTARQFTPFTKPSLRRDPPPDDARPTRPTRTSNCESRDEPRLSSRSNERERGTVQLFGYATPRGWRELSRSRRVHTQLCRLGRASGSCASLSRVSRSEEGRSPRPASDLCQASRSPRQRDSRGGVFQPQYLFLGARRRGSIVTQPRHDSHCPVRFLSPTCRRPSRSAPVV